MKKKTKIDIWTEETFRRYGDRVLKDPWICLLLTQSDMKDEGIWPQEELEGEKV